MTQSKVQKLGDSTEHSPSHAGTARLSAERRREQLLQVAVHLFSRKGFNGTTTREIAAAAGVTEAIIFRHFATKEDLYTAIIDQRLKSADAREWLKNIKLAMDADDDEAVMRQLISAIIAGHRDDPEFQRLMLYAALEGNEIALIFMRAATAAVVDEFRRYVARRQERGALRAMTPDAALAAIAGMAKCYGLNKYVHGFDEQGLSDDEAVDLFTKVAMSGLALKHGNGRGPKARKA